MTTANAALSCLYPQGLWDHFTSLAQIPRPSGKEEQVLAHIKGWAKAHGYAFQEDAAGNLLVRMPATQGREKAPSIALQSHVDMVCVRAQGSPHDPAVGPVPVVREGEWVGTGAHTTLGADNGIGVSAMLYAGEPKATPHGPVELLFTVDEERGLTGAMQFDQSLLQSRTLLNLDSEDDSAFYVGAAGGQQITYRVAWPRLSRNAEGWKGLAVDVRLLKGGHSGTDIDKGRLNAVQAVARLLRAAAQKTQLSLCRIEGGSQTNVIPSTCRAEIQFPADAEVAVTEALQIAERELREQYQEVEEGWSCTFMPLPPERTPEVLDPASTERLADFLLAIPSGIITMSQRFPGLVETSANLGVIREANGELEVAVSVRSGTPGGLRDIFERLQAVGRLAGVRMEASPAFPPWAANRSSPLHAACERAYRFALKRDPGFKAVHAGLECSLIGAKVPGLEMIPFGPTIEGAHTPHERVNILSVERFWKVLSALLDELSR